MRNYLLLLIIASINIVAFATLPDNEKPMTLNEALQRHLLLTAAIPKYPGGYEWKPDPRGGPSGHSLMGDGIFDLRFDYESGLLREIHVVKSTDNTKLDTYAIGALKVWTATPGVDPSSSRSDLLCETRTRMELANRFNKSVEPTPGAIALLRFRFP